MQNNVTHRRSHQFVYKSQNGMAILKSFAKPIGAPVYNHDIDRTRKGSKERSPASLQRSIRRVKRLATANYTKHTKMWTLTFGANKIGDRDLVLDIKVARRYFELFLDRLRIQYPNVKYLATFEKHESGHYHIHMAIFNIERIEKRKMQDIWSYGIVRFSKKENKEVLFKPMKLGYYLSKYISKTFSENKEMVEIKVYYRSRDMFDFETADTFDSTLYDEIDSYTGHNDILGFFEIRYFLYSEKKALDYFNSLYYTVPIIQFDV